MSESSDTSIIDDKKTESTTSNNGNYVSNIGSFLLTVFIIFLIIVVYYASSGLVLYACKLAQSNILPTDIHCFPYTETKPDIQPIQTNIFTTFTEPQLSMKMSFPYDEFNSSNKILDMFREYKNKSSSNFLANYFISIMESLIHFNYSAINTILNMLNGLPEVLLIIFGPIIVGFLSTIIFIVDHLYIIYLWFSNMGWFFKTNSNNSGTGEPKWEDVQITEPINYLCAIWLLIIFVVLFFFLFPGFSVISALAMTWCTFSCTTYKAEMLNKSISVAPIIQDIFKYYKTPIMSIFSFFVIISAFSKLGPLPGVFSLVTLALIYFGILSIDIFNPIKKDNLSPVVSYNQAKKTCSFKEISKGKHGLLYNLIFGQSGGSLTRELKNIGKKLKM